MNSGVKKHIDLRFVLAEFNWMLVCSFCVSFTISVIYFGAEILIHTAYAGSMISNITASSAPFTINSANDSSNCDFTSYPDFCIPIPPPNLNCDDVDGTDFTVFPPDPHGFDRDKDGEGCETSE